MDIVDAFDIDELYDGPCDEIENAEWDLEPEFGPTPPPEVHNRTDELAEFEKVMSVIKHMNEVEIRLDTFMAALFYGNAKCTSDIEHMRGARKQLTQNPLSHTILNNVFKVIAIPCKERH
ncbi:callose synthase 2 [Ceratobasidium sp. AG-Ba]|nr:callose synthase 2 [Ceratobasidium sp. AG-Ba]